MEYSNTNRGAIWTNKKHSENPKAPKWTGKLDVEGVAYYVSAWAGKQEPNQPSLTFVIQKVDAPVAIKEGDKFDDIPF
tara:strand:- start:706 stop:939 length:234 start_codon:yes stop_codon:yes gene_type:complete